MLGSFVIRVGHAALVLVMLSCRPMAADLPCDMPHDAGSGQADPHFLRWADGSAAQPPKSIAQLATSIFRPQSPWAVLRDEIDSQLQLTRVWEPAKKLNGTSQRRLRSSVQNVGDRSVHLQSIELLRITHGLPPEGTAIYGEGFQMLSQTEGTILNPIDLSQYTDRHHYHLQVPEDMIDVYGILHLSTIDFASSDDGNVSTDDIVLAFTSCLRFAGKFLISDNAIKVVLDLDGIQLLPGETAELEDLLVLHSHRRTASGSTRTRDHLFRVAGSSLYQTHLAAAARAPHTLASCATGRCAVAPRLTAPRVTGWCSWYAHGFRVTVDDIRAAARDIKIFQREGVPLQYLQIDDGYQKHMGDWLDASHTLGVSMDELVHELNDQGVDVALWVAPFVAGKDSRVLADHPEWFVKDPRTSQPLASDVVTFGGWREAPWFVLDGCHPEVQAHLEHLFRHFHSRWKIRYFKLDALFWGVMGTGTRFASRPGNGTKPRQCTRIEGYRLGMAAIRRGAPGSYFVGANHPVWASVGLLEASRLSGDVYRHMNVLRSVGRESLLRGWQHRVLWHGDPDVVVLAQGVGGMLPIDQALFSASVCLAVGGVTLSGDWLSSVTGVRRRILERLVKAPPHADPGGLTWEDSRLQAGCLRWAGAGRGYRVIFLFNWEVSPCISFNPARSCVCDYRSMLTLL